MLVLTEWPEFRQLGQMDWKQVRGCVALPIGVDGRNCLDAAALRAEGFEYDRMGEASPVPDGIKI